MNTKVNVQCFSQIGMAQQHQLGQILRERYVTTTFPGYLNKSYTRVQVSIDPVLRYVPIK